MRASHLHSVGRDGPDGGVDIKLGPSRKAKLARALGKKCKEYKSDTRGWLAFESVDCSQKAAQLLRISDRGARFDRGSNEGITESKCWVNFRNAVRNRIAENRANFCAQPPSGLLVAFRFNFAQALQHHWRRDFADRSLAKVGFRHS